MKVAIVGSRDFTDFSKVVEALKPYEDKITTVISGGARGADSLAEDWADKYGKSKHIFEAQWGNTEGKPHYEIGYNKYGAYWKFAGHHRNDLMAEECDCCVAFWDGESSGTKDMIQACKDKNKPVKIVYV